MVWSWGRRLLSVRKAQFPRHGTGIIFIRKKGETFSKCWDCIDWPIRAPPPALCLVISALIMSAKLLFAFFLLSVLKACSRKIEDDEYEDFAFNQKWVLAPKTQDTDATLILNKLMREYDKKLRPDIGIKPTVIDVDIYVNSIGPVSSINMVSDCGLFFNDFSTSANFPADDWEMKCALCMFFGI
ncbi:gamma-aminobutyric acid receptor subunit gamma-3-like [Lissotriton helveticus]